MRRFGLIGYPLTHSFSKKYFTEKFLCEGITDATYDLYPITHIEELDLVIQSHPDLEGINVTIPYKQLVLNKLHSIENIPPGVGACNCIRIVHGEFTGYNTDVIGFQKSFISGLAAHHQKALILGNGGATAAVAFVLTQLKISYQVVSRQPGNPSTLTYRDLDRAIMNDHTIIINTTPLGMYPAVENCPPVPYEYIGNRHYLFDLIYNPAKTLFLQKGEANGATIKNGLEMLIIQAEESWKIWNE
jgi:shikimate dehydrogenase